MNFRDELAVDLNLVGSDIGQGAQRRIAGAKIINRYTHTNLAKARKNFVLKRTLGNEGIFSQFDDDAVGLLGISQRLRK